MTATGADLVEQVEKIRLVERDIELEDFSIVNFSHDFEGSQLINDLHPQLWFAMVEDESDVHYATTQLPQDYEDLAKLLGDDPVAALIADPEKAEAIKHEVLDVFYDIDILRDRTRRLVGRACWFLSEGKAFLGLKPIAEMEDDYKSHKEWIDRAARNLGPREAGGGDCFTMLRYQPPQ